MSTRAITLFGKILESSHSGRLVIDVEPTMGDAPEFSLAGQVTVLERQALETNEGPLWDLIRLPAHVAESLRSQPRRRR